ncbi:MAG: PKD domain-containing protein [Thermoplasmatota archaeon]
MASLNLTVAAGRAPLYTNITAAASDPDGDAVTGSVSFGDASPAVKIAKFPMKLAHNFTVAGNYTVTLTVSDGNLMANATAHVTVAAPASNTIHITDPKGDAKSSYTDIVAVDAGETPTAVNMVISLVSVWPEGVGYSPVGYTATLNGGDFRCYAYQTGILLWDVTAGAYVKSPNGSCSWDSTANTVTIQLLPSYLAKDKITPPFQLSTSTNEGGLVNNEATNTDDLAPDSGTILLP